MGTQTQFENLLRDIEPSPTTKSNASVAHTTLRQYLAGHEEYRKVHLNTFLSGSYKRDTSIRPRTRKGKISRPDIDIIVVVNNTRDDSPKAVIGYLRSTLSENYEIDRSPHTRSVGVVTSDVKMDVVPLIAPSGMEGTLYLPDKKAEEWLVTNPPGHSAWTTDVNKTASGRFKPLVKLMKWWRLESPTISKRPKGFVIECIVAECMSYRQNNYPELFLGTLETVVTRYSGDVSFGRVPRIADPSVPKNSVTDGLTFDAFAGLYNKANTHAELGRQALDEEDEEVALELWQQIFGPRFPQKAKRTAKGLLSDAVVPSPLTFPDRPIVPKKPGGFA